MQIPSCANSIVWVPTWKFRCVRNLLCANSSVWVTTWEFYQHRPALFVRLEGDFKCSVALLAVRVGVGICLIRPGWRSSARYGLVGVGVLMQVPSIVRILLYAFFYALHRADSRADYCAYTIMQISCTVQISPSRLCRVSHCASFSMRISLYKFYLCVPISIVWIWIIICTIVCSIVCSIVGSIVCKFYCVNFYHGHSIVDILLYLVVLLPVRCLFCANIVRIIVRSIVRIIIYSIVCSIMRSILCGFSIS